jgi:hypothetical protein
MATTCPDSALIYPAAVIDSVIKQMSEVKEPSESATEDSDTIPLKLQLTPSMRASNIRDALVSPSSLVV